MTRTPEAAWRPPLPRGGNTSGPAKRLCFGVGSHRTSDVMPQPKPDPRCSLGGWRLSSWELLR